MSRSVRRALGAVALAIVVAACGGTPVGTAANGSLDRPSVSIQAPGEGAQVPLGQDVTVAGLISDTVGADHVELFVDGVSFGTAAVDQSAPSQQFSIDWLAAPAGQHGLQVVAYRSDGTASDPASVDVTVGSSATATPGPASASPSVGSSPSSTPGTPTVGPTMTASPTPAPTAPPTASPTTTPTPTPTPPPSPTGTPGLTPLPDGTAPDDSAYEPHLIKLQSCAGLPCPSGVLAMGSITEQISAPAGDQTDELYFVPQPKAHYQLQMTGCKTTGGTVAWQIEGGDPSLMPGCGDSLYELTALAPSNITVKVFFSGGTGLLKIACTTKLPCYSMYTFAVYQLAQ